jgi:hypothetical protein
MATKKRASKSTSTRTTTPATPAVTPPAPPSPTSPALIQSSSPITGVANGSNKGTKIDLQTSYQAFVAGMLAYYQPGDTFPLKSGTLTRDEVVTEVQQFITAAENTKTSNKAWRADVQTERAVLSQVAPIRKGVRGIVEAKFGEDGIELLNFGFEPRKPPVKTAASKAGAAVKAKATREARGTKGSVQKKDIHGTVPAAPTTTEASAAPAAMTTTKA